jgi:ADP-heptose:LPS heptosyltransferase
MDNEERSVPSVKLSKEEFELKLLLLGFTPQINGFLIEIPYLFLEEYKPNEYVLWGGEGNILKHWPAEAYAEVIEYLGNMQ